MPDDYFTKALRGDTVEWTISLRCAPDTKISLIAEQIQVINKIIDDANYVNRAKILGMKMQALIVLLELAVKGNSDAKLVLVDALKYVHGSLMEHSKMIIIFLGEGLHWGHYAAKPKYQENLNSLRNIFALAMVDHALMGQESVLLELEYLLRLFTENEKYYSQEEKKTFRVILEAKLAALAEDPKYSNNSNLLCIKSIFLQYISTEKGAVPPFEAISILLDKAIALGNPYAMYARAYNYELEHGNKMDAREADFPHRLYSHAAIVYNYAPAHKKLILYEALKVLDESVGHLKMEYHDKPEILQSIQNLGSMGQNKILLCAQDDSFSAFGLKKKLSEELSTLAKVQFQQQAVILESLKDKILTPMVAKNFGISTSEMQQTENMSIDDFTNALKGTTDINQWVASLKKLALDKQVQEISAYINTLDLIIDDPNHQDRLKALEMKQNCLCILMELTLKGNTKAEQLWEAELTSPHGSPAEQTNFIAVLGTELAALNGLDALDKFNAFSTKTLTEEKINSLKTSCVLAMVSFVIDGEEAELSKLDSLLGAVPMKQKYALIEELEKKFEILSQDPKYLNNSNLFCIQSIALEKLCVSEDSHLPPYEDINQLLDEAIKLGNQYAMWKLAENYEMGLGSAGEPDLEGAVKLYANAAKSYNHGPSIKALQEPSLQKKMILFKASQLLDKCVKELQADYKDKPKILKKISKFNLEAKLRTHIYILPGDKTSVANFKLKLCKDLEDLGTKHFKHRHIILRFIADMVWIPLGFLSIGLLFKAKEHFTGNRYFLRDVLTNRQEIIGAKVLNSIESTDSEDMIEELKSKPPEL